MAMGVKRTRAASSTAWRQPVPRAIGGSTKRMPLTAMPITINTPMSAVMENP